MGFEPTNGGFADQSWFSILLVRLAFTPAHLADFGPDLAPIVPKLFPSFEVTPSTVTKSLGTLAAFYSAFAEPSSWKSRSLDNYPTPSYGILKIVAGGGELRMSGEQTLFQNCHRTRQKRNGFTWARDVDE